MEMIGKPAEPPLSPSSERPPPSRPHPGSSELFRRYLPVGDETAMKTAMYNALFFVVTLMGLAGIFAVYHLLYMFLKPMLWATLVGTVLFPFKRKVNSVMRGRLLCSKCFADSSLFDRKCNCCGCGCSVSIYESV